MRTHANATPSKSIAPLLFVSLFVALFVFTAQPGMAAETLQPEHIAKFKYVTSAVISPDGKQIAYTLRVQRDPFNEDDGSGWVELHVVGTDGVSRPFVTGKVNVGNVAWTPDGKYISFLAEREGDDEKSLYQIPIDGGEAWRIVTHETGISSYSWNPDGSKVAFLATDARPESVEKLRDRGFDQEIYEEDKPFVRVWTHSMDDPDTLSHMLDLPGSASELYWSPDGSKLALALAPTPYIDDNYMSCRVHIVDAESGAIIAKLKNPGKLGRMAWSPDGAHLAFVSAADYNDPKEGRLMVARASGGELTDLLPNFEGHVTQVTWRDPHTITYLASQGVWSYIENVGLDAATDVTIFAAPEQADIDAPAPLGAPEVGAVYSSISLSRDGQAMAMVGESPRHPDEVYFRAKGKHESIRLTDSNPWLAGMRLARQEVIRYPARDGLELEAILIRPLDEQPNQRYPLILQVHGGPESHYRNEWMTWYSAPGQMAAARGFAVLYPNYRGSTGRGVAFSKLSQGDPAGKEFDDLVDGIDYLVGKGLVDEDRVGITGGSYGGFASAWGATYYSDRFAASVMFIGVSDLVSKIGTTDIPNEMLAVHYLENPWDNWPSYLERSPINYAGQSHTPTLILHGKEDPRVNPGQSRELYRHLKLRGQAPVRLVLYPGEGHGNSRAASRLDYNLRQLRWFEHYLKGPGGDPPPYDIDYERM